jgi:hypothetical protein
VRPVFDVRINRDLNINYRDGDFSVAKKGERASTLEHSGTKRFSVEESISVDL